MIIQPVNQPPVADIPFRKRIWESSTKTEKILWTAGIVTSPYTAPPAARLIRWLVGGSLDLVGTWLINLPFSYAATANTLNLVFFGYVVGWNGAKMFFAPYTEMEKYLKIDGRFKSEAVMKQNLVNISDLVNQDMKKSLEDYDKAKNKVEDAKKKAINCRNLAAPEIGLGNRGDKKIISDAETAEAELLKAEEELKALSLKPNPKPAASQKIPQGKKSTPLEGMYVNRYTIEKTKPKPGEWQINIPLSKEAILFNPQEYGKAWMKTAASLPIVSLGLLGIANSLNEFRGPVNDKGETWLYQKAPNLTYAASIVGKPTKWIIDGAGSLIGTLMTAKIGGYPLGSLFAAGALGYSGCKLITGGLGYGKYVTKKPKFVWFRIKKDKSKPTTFKSDIFKIAGGITLIGAAILSANNFFNPKA